MTSPRIAADRWGGTTLFGTTSWGAGHDSDALIARYLSSELLDSAFNTQGFLLFDGEGGNDAGRA